MGMFDSVCARYPKCNSRIEFQSKAGDCNLDQFEIDEVPMEIAAALDGSIKRCDNCDEKVELRLPKTSPKYVAMKVRLPIPARDY